MSDVSRSRLLRWFATVLFSIAVLPIAQQFFVELARDYGLYDQPAERVEFLMKALATDARYRILVAFLGGLLVGTTIDRLVQ